MVQTSLTIHSPYPKSPLSCTGFLPLSVRPSLLSTWFYFRPCYTINGASPFHLRKPLESSPVDWDRSNLKGLLYCNSDSSRDFLLVLKLSVCFPFPVRLVSFVAPESSLRLVPRLRRTSRSLPVRHSSEDLFPEGTVSPLEWNLRSLESDLVRKERGSWVGFPRRVDRRQRIPHTGQGP